MQKTDIKTFSKLFILETGKPIQLEHWQEKYIFDPVFGTFNRNGLRRFNLVLIGLPKKNGKSTLASMVGAYGLLADGEPEVEIYGAAGDKDQAKIIFTQTVKAIKRSPILLNEVNIYKDVIERKDGTGFYKVLSADAPTSHGLNAHFVLWDELWNQKKYDLWEGLTHSAARKQPIHFIVTYAGYSPHPGNLLYDLYLAGKKGKDKRMHFFWTNKNYASWVSKDYLKQQRLRLPEHIFKRLHKNEWTSGSGAFLGKLDIAAATDITLKNRFEGERGKHYFAALDLGLRRDKTAFAIVHQEPNGTVILDHMKTWEAPKGGEVSIQSVEEHILDLYPRFKFAKIVFDPWQSIRTKQAFGNYGIQIEEFTFSGANWTKLTETLFSLFKDRRIKIFPHKELIKELMMVKIIEKSYGYRIDHDSGAHDDHVVALGMAALQAFQKTGVIPRISVVGSGSKPTPQPQGEPKKPVLKPGQQAVPVWEGDRIIRYDIIGGGRRHWIPGIK